MKDSGNLSNSEREDFHSAIKKRGLQENDFDLTTERINPNYPIQMTVIVKRKSNGIEKAYIADHETHWIVNFSEDLENGFYD